MVQTYPVNFEIILSFGPALFKCFVAINGRELPSHSHLIVFWDMLGVNYCDHVVVVVVVYGHSAFATFAHAASLSQKLNLLVGSPQFVLQLVDLPFLVRDQALLWVHIYLRYV